MTKRQEEIGLRAVVDAAVDGVMLLDFQGLILRFNPACERLFGYRTEEVVGQNARILVPPGEDSYRHYLRSGTREITCQHKDGSKFPVELSVGKSGEGEDTIFAVFVHDMTARKRTEAQLVQAQKMEMVGQLSGGIAHDFNNLLTVILGNAEALSLRLKSRQDLRNLADAIVSSAEHGAQLTQRLLAFSRRQVLQPAAVDCNALMNGMQVLLRRALRNDIEVRASLADNLPRAMADAAQLESAILNLSLNAQDAMPQGGAITLITSETALDADAFGPGRDVRAGQYIVVCVSDDGEGMSPEVQARAFEPFFTTKEVGKGSGLGLSMVYGFAKQSGGHVSIYSEAGLGTSVRLYLPVADGQNTPEREAAMALSHVAPTGSETVLVVEDDPLVRDHAVSTLEGLGYRVLVAKDGREALAMLRGGAEIDLLFTDIVMPGGLSGLELARGAEVMAPNLRVLFTSGYPLEALAARTPLPDNAALLNKPYRMAELARMVRASLDSAH